MRRTIITAAAGLFILLASCGGRNEKAFVINGNVNQARLEGQKIFLVPLDDSVKNIIGVDSVVIKDMKFTFKGKGEFLADIRLDWRVRYGTQNLLVITEPGATTVTIDSNSVSKGTPQNDALQQWKDMTIKTNKTIYNQTKHVRYLTATGDTAYARRLQDSIKVYAEFFRNESRNMAVKFKPGTTFREFIMKMYPEKANAK